MRITYLVEAVDGIWGGVKVVLEDANWLHDRGHRVTVLSRTPPPDWMELRCAFRKVAGFSPDNVPQSDLVVGTFWSTVPAAVESGRGVPVHYCQGFEGGNPENADVRDRIEAVYRMPEPYRITISGHLSRQLEQRFGIRAREVVYSIDHRVFFPGRPRPLQGRVRVGLVGPYEVVWKDIPTGLEACSLASRAGLDLELVRVTNTKPHPDELDLDYPVEWHRRVPPAAMGDIYRSLDVFLGTSRGDEEGFFLPAVEAMACGVPAVLTEIPCFLGYGEGQYALFVQPQDPGAMAEALVLAARHPKVHHELRANGPAVAARYNPEDHGAALERALCEILEEAGRDPAAIASHDTLQADLRSLDDSLIRALRQAAEAVRGQGSYRRAVDYLNAALCVRERDAGVLRDLAYNRHLHGDDAAALRILDDLLRTERGDPGLHVQRGLVLMTMGDFTAAADAFQAAIDAGDASADNYNNLGVARFQAGDTEAAERSFRKALELDPQHADARVNLPLVKPHGAAH